MTKLSIGFSFIYSEIIIILSLLFFKFTVFIKIVVFREYLIKYIYPNWEKLLKNVECR